MNIAHLVDHLETGGMERVVVDLARYQKLQGHNVRVYCIHQKGALAGELLEVDIPVRAYHKTPGFKASVVRQLRKSLRKHQVDVLHIHNAYANLYGVCAGRWAGVRRIINTRHGMGNLSTDPRKEGIFRLTSFGLDRIALVCDEARSHFIRNGIVSERKALTVYNGISLAPYADERYDYRLEREDKRGTMDDRRGTMDEGRGATGDASFRHPDERSEEGSLQGVTTTSSDVPTPILIGTVARLEEVKNIELLIRSVRVLTTEGFNVRCVIAGNGRRRETLEALADSLGLKNIVRFLGNRTDVPVVLSWVDIFVLPSFSEGMSLTLIEAMAAGCAVVATRVGGNPEVVQDGKSGLLVKSDNVQEMTAALRRLIQNPTLRKQLGGEARARAFTMFSLEGMAARYDVLYGGICV